MDLMAVLDGLLHRGEDLRVGEHVASAGGARHCIVTEMVALRRHKPQVREPKVEHVARSRTHVLIQERADQDHHRRKGVCSRQTCGV